MRTVKELPPGFVDLQCKACQTRYSYWNGTISAPGSDRPPRCPECGGGAYQRVFTPTPMIDNGSYTLTRGQLSRAEALAMAHRYYGQKTDANEIVREYGKYIAKEND